MVYFWHALPSKERVTFLISEDFIVILEAPEKYILQNLRLFANF